MNDEIIYGEDINWGKYGKDIIPSPIYQVYRIKGVWTGDDGSPMVRQQRHGAIERNGR